MYTKQNAYMEDYAAEDYGHDQASDLRRIMSQRAETQAINAEEPLSVSDMPRILKSLLDSHLDQKLAFDTRYTFQVTRYNRSYFAITEGGKTILIPAEGNRQLLNYFCNQENYVSFHYSDEIGIYMKNSSRSIPSQP